MKIIRNDLIFFVLGLIVFSSCGKKFVPAFSGVKLDKTYDSTTFDYVYVEAIKQKLLGNNGDALSYLEHCVKINPLSDAAYYQMAQIVAANGDLNASKKYITKALSLDEKNIWYLRMLSGIYYQTKNLDSAIIFYEKAIKYFPDNQSLKMTLGNLYSENKNFGKATTVFNSVDEQFGINDGSTVSAVKNYILAGKFKEAEEKANLLLKEFPEEIIYNGLLAEIYYGEGKNDKAMEVYNKLIERNPENPQIQLALCDFLLNSKKYDDLLRMLNTVSVNDQISRENKITLFAKILEQEEIIKSEGEKLKFALMVLEANYKTDDIILLLRPDLLTKMNNLSEAAIRLEEIIKDRPENYYAWEKLLLVYLQEKDYLNLEKKGEECATMFNRSFLAKILYANGAMENKHYTVALEELRKAAILAGDDKELNIQVLTIKADIYYRMKDYDKTFKTFDEAIKLNSEDLTIINNYAYYLCEQSMKLKEAEAMSKKVIARERTNTSYLDTYGWILYKRGKIKSAAKIMEEIIAGNNQPDAVWYEHYGYILKKQRNCKKAIENWEIALKLDSTKNNLKTEIENCKKLH